MLHHPQMAKDESLEEALRGLKMRATMFPDESIKSLPAAWL
jgi:hypothetical protein